MYFNVSSREKGVKPYGGVENFLIFFKKLFGITKRQFLIEKLHINLSGCIFHNALRRTDAKWSSIFILILSGGFNKKWIRASLLHNSRRLTTKTRFCSIKQPKSLNVVLKRFEIFRNGTSKSKRSSPIYNDLRIKFQKKIEWKTFLKIWKSRLNHRR